MMRLTLEARDAAGVLGGLALRVVEVGRHRDDGLGHRLAEVVLGGLLHLHEHARRDLRRRHLLALHLDPGVAVVGLDDLVGHHADVLLHHLVVELAADQALDREQRVLRIGDRLALGGLADQHLVVLGEGDDRRRGAVALAVLDHARLAAFHDGDAGVGRAEVDADYLCHGRHSAEKTLEEEGCSYGHFLGMAGRAFKGQRRLQPGARATMTRAGRNSRPLSS